MQSAGTETQTHANEAHSSKRAAWRISQQIEAVSEAMVDVRPWYGG
jgi:hypothetical protein